MPEPTAAGPDELDLERIEDVRAEVARWAPSGHGLMFNLATISALLNAYDQRGRDLDALSIAVSDQSKRAREAAARVAAAEAALTDLRRAYAELVDQTAPTQPDLDSVSGIVNAAPDDQQVTVRGWIHHIEPRANQAGAPYAEVVLADETADNEGSDPATLKVVVPAPVYFRTDHRVLREGMLVEFAGRAVRDVVVIASGVRPVEAAQISQPSVAVQTEGGAL